VADAFAPERFPVPIREDLLEAQRTAWDRLASAGAWLDAEHRREVADVARGADPRSDVGRLARWITLSPQAVDRRWATEQMGVVGAEQYVETVAVTATVVAIDRFADAVGADAAPLPEPQPGTPSGERAVETADIGAHVPVDAAAQGANVGRAMSLVPAANRLFFALEQHMYASGDDFWNLTWNRPLSRPQVELVAARTSALNECFY
jgi:hypothetical protein